MLTILLRVSGTDARGTFVVYGGRASESSGTVRTLSNTSLDDARRSAVGLVSAVVGSKVRCLSGEANWCQAAD